MRTISLFILLIGFFLFIPGYACSAELNPVAHWNFDAGIGRAVYDIKNGHKGIMKGAVWLSEIGERGKFGDGIYIGKTGQKIELNVGLTLGDEWTIEAWFKPPLPAYTTYGDNILLSGASGSNVEPIGIADNNGQLEIGTYNKTESKWYTTTRDVTKMLGNKDWRHIAVVGQANTTKYYIDGASAGNVDIQVKGEILYIGNGFGEDFNMDNAFGRIDEVYIYDKVLTVSEIEARAGK